MLFPGDTLYSVTGGDILHNDFVLTKISNVILCEAQASDKVIAFRNNLSCSELIYHISGKSLVCFNGKTALCEKNTIRFLPKGENRNYTVNRMDHIECMDIFFDTDTCISAEMFTIKLNNDIAIAPLFKKIFSLWVAKNDGYYFECLSLLYKIFASVKNKHICRRANIGKLSLPLNISVKTSLTKYL